MNRCTLGDACHFAHVRDAAYKVKEDKPCRSWILTGRCDLGEMCWYAHEREGAEDPAQGLTEQNLAEAFEEMRAAKLRSEETDDDEDDVEIVSRPDLQGNRSRLMLMLCLGDGRYVEDDQSEYVDSVKGVERTCTGIEAVFASESSADCFVCIPSIVIIHSKTQLDLELGCPLRGPVKDRSRPFERYAVCAFLGMQ